MRLAKLAAIAGVALLALSFVCPAIEPSYDVVLGLSPGFYRGYVVTATDDIHLRVWSWEDEVFSVYFMDYENGKIVLEEQSMANATTLQSFSNRTSLDEYVHVDTPGWYAVLVAPAGNEEIRVLNVEISRANPNKGLLFTGALTILFAMVLAMLVSSRWSAGQQSVYRSRGPP